MSRPSFAISRPVNPIGALPVLTEAQVWAGLGIKARQPQSFVASITSCDVVSDDGERIVRSVSFNGGEVVTEKVELHESTIAYFDIASLGIRITNVLSYGVDDELLLTFSFANGIPGLPPGEPLPNAKELNRSLGRGVEHTIDRIRELVKEGKIQ